MRELQFASAFVLPNTQPQSLPQSSETVNLTV